LNLEVFCCLGLLKFPEQMELSMNLLVENDKAEATRLLEAMKALSAAELVQKWSSLRSAEYLAVNREVHNLSGVHLDDLPPALREWWSLWAEHQHE
jgi:hypothetical protein